MKDSPRKPVDGTGRNGAVERHRPGEVADDRALGGTLARQYGLDPLDQVSFAVESVEAALPAFEAIFGPFSVRRVRFTPDKVRYRGQPAEAELVLAFGRSGDLEIELVEVADGDAPTLEHLRRHGPGIHHLRFPVPALEATLATMNAEGFVTVLEGVGPSGARFAFVEAPGRFGHALFELIQFPPA